MKQKLDVVRECATTGRMALVLLRDRLAALPDFSAESIESCLRETSADTGASMRLLCEWLRFAVTGDWSGPPVHGASALIGRDMTIRRIWELEKAIAAGSF